jgi:hypothetical protein
MSPATIYICTACGKTGPSPESFRDESCWHWAVLCYANSIERSPDGRVIKAEAVPAVPTDPPEVILVHTDMNSDRYNGITKR